MSEPEDGSRERVQSVETLLRIIEALEESDGGTITELADELGVAKSTIFRHITTLEERRYVVSDGKTVKLGTAFLRLGNSVRYQRSLYRKVEPVVESLATDTEERANFFIEEFGQSVCIHRKYGAKGVKGDTRIGKRFPMHATAAGKAMLSQLSQSRVEKIIETHGLENRTENTITTMDELTAELETIRDQSVAINDEEYILNLRSIGTPICTKSGDIIGAFTVSGPTNRFSDERLEELTTKVLEAKNEAELEIQYGNSA
jgi:DNA-binding IclR family transcriptional regulator